MSDFFATLELELRAAAERGPRRWPAWAPSLRGAAAAALVAALLALALVPAVALLGDGDDGARDRAPALFKPAPVRTVYEKGQGTPPRESRSTVVATGVAPVAGPWQMETYTSTRLADPDTGEVYQQAGARCLGIYLAPGLGAGGQCGEFPRTPGFSRVQMTVQSRQGGADEILVYGRVPVEASAVVVTVDGVERRRVEPIEGPSGVEGDFYLVAIPPEWNRGRVNWLDENGNAGSVGAGLLPR